MTHEAPRVSRIAAIVLRAPDPPSLARFYRDALDFVDAPGDGDALCLVLGSTRLRIEPSAPRGASYPGDVPGWSPLFQHFAIRVADMGRATARLDQVLGWRAISTHGPQTLPAASGGATAFKFRDSDGHPLELLFLPQGSDADGPLFAGIDHSAISVADVDRSIAFYERLGFAVAGRTVNRGTEQSWLDGIDDATVDVVGMTLGDGPPHLELLGYRGGFDRSQVAPAGPDDVAATRLVLAGARASTTVRDPDGHLLTFVD